MRHFSIRQCTTADLAQVHALQMQWAAESSTHGFVPSSKDDLAKKLGPHFLVADSDGTLAGFVYGSIHVSDGLAVIPAPERYFEIDDLYVKPDFRSQNIGGALLDKLMAIARQTGIQRFLVYSATKDLNAVLRFYRRHGFKSWNVRMYI